MGAPWASPSLVRVRARHSSCSCAASGSCTGHGLLQAAGACCWPLSRVGRACLACTSALEAAPAWPGQHHTLNMLRQPPARAVCLARLVLAPYCLRMATMLGCHTLPPGVLQPGLPSMARPLGCKRHTCTPCRRGQAGAGGGRAQQVVAAVEGAQLHHRAPAPRQPGGRARQSAEVNLQAVQCCKLPECALDPNTPCLACIMHGLGWLPRASSPSLLSTWPHACAGEGATLGQACQRVRSRWVR